MKIIRKISVVTELIAIVLITLFIQAGCEKEVPQQGQLSFNEKYSIQSVCSELFLSAKPDVMGRPYLFVASKEGGIKIYNITASPQLIKTIPTSSLLSLHAMNLSKVGNYLFVALGNHFGTAHQHPGMAIIDVSDPAQATVTATWSDNTITGGAGIVETSGQYAYLGAMQNGLFIFDISNKNNPVLKSVFKPSITYPDANPDPKKYNARGLAIRNDLVFLCFDAGGIRVINIADKDHPVEVGRYSNPVMNGKPRAYNSIVLDGNDAYAGVDYCGLEVLDISNPGTVALKSWWNPWECQTSALKWFSSPGHINEVVFDPVKKLVFMSSGKSDMQVVNVSNPAKPKHAGEFGGVNNNIGTWGVSRLNSTLYLTYICSLVPFSSNWTGVKIIEYK